MKVILKTGEEFPVNSLSKLSDNQIQISFAGITDYTVFRSKLVVSALKGINYYPTDDNTTFEVYENYTGLIDPVSISTASDGTLNVAIVLEKEDEVNLKINELSERQSLVEDALNELILG